MHGAVRIKETVECETLQDVFAYRETVECAVISNMNNCRRGFRACTMFVTCELVSLALGLQPFIRQPCV